MAKIILSVRMPHTSEFDKITRFLEGLSADRREKFVSEWKILESHGAQSCDAGTSYGVVSVWFSDDFRQHCRKYGFHFLEAK